MDEIKRVQASSRLIDLESLFRGMANNMSLARRKLFEAHCNGLVTDANLDPVMELLDEANAIATKHSGDIYEAITHVWNSEPSAQEKTDAPQR